MGFISWLLADEIDLAVERYVTDERLDALVSYRLGGSVARAAKRKNGRKLGMLSADPERLDNAKRMGRFLDTSTPPAHPAAVDYMSKIKTWILGSNDRYGTCGPTSVANFALLVSTWLGDAPVTFTDDEIFDLYRRSGNPKFDPKTGADDNGVDMTVMLSALVSGGIGFGKRNVKALAYAAITPTDTNKLWAAGSLFGGVLWGADLMQAQDAQIGKGLWDYVGRSRPWGGHAVFSAGSYVDRDGTVSDRTDLITWQQRISATDNFIVAQVKEAYVVLFPWHLANKRFVQNTDLATLAQDFTAITGKPFPAVVPPAPAPTPTPAPVPGNAADVEFAAVVDSFYQGPFARWRKSKGI